MSAELQIFFFGFDIPFFKLPPQVQLRLVAKIDDMGLNEEWRIRNNIF